MLSHPLRATAQSLPQRVAPQRGRLIDICFDINQEIRYGIIEGLS